jgi:hypothetical protein
MKSSTTKEKEPAQPAASDLSDAARRNFEQVMRTTFKWQEEASRWWTTMATQAGTMQDWQKRMNTLTGTANSFMPLVQKRMEDVVELLEKNGRTTAELVRKAADASQTPVLADSQAKWMEFWTSSLGAVRSNAEALGEISTRSIDSWIGYVRKNSEMQEVRVPKGA